MAFENVRSIVGRRLGLSSTGGLVQAYNSTGKQSTDFIMAAQMWGDAMVSVTTSSAGTLSNVGVSVISYPATAAAAYSVAAPIKGVSKEIWITSSASALTFGGTSTSQVFMKIGAGTAGSTIVSLTDANLAGQVIVLRGLSATQWGILSPSTAIQT